MDQTKYFAFYGSLRRGMPLYEQYQSHLVYQFSAWLKSFALYSLGPYPYAIRSTEPSSKILVEVFHIESEHIRQEIETIELKAGYVFEDIDIRGIKSRIFLFTKNGNDPKVISGDWVDFFGR